ncbi:MAG TPA: DUF1702 family protein [Herpetosiphonaceae bacterium]
MIGVSPQQATSFSEGNTPAWKQLETAVLAAIEGYHATLDDHRLEVLVPRLNTIDLEVRGYAYEGAAMGLTGLDCMMPWKNRLQEYLDGAGGAHTYMVHIGVGEALARLRRKPEPFLKRLDPVLRWLAMDGYGFHEGFFKQRRYIEGQTIPAHLSPYARRIFDQGIGRAIWFLNGANVDRIVDKIVAFPPARQADLWCGIGVGCAYGGGVERAGIERLQAAAGQYAPQLALGAAVVAKGRQRAGNPTPHSDLACEVLCGTSSEVAAHAVDVAFQNLPIDGPEPAYAVLQQRLFDRFAGVGRQKEVVQ